MSENTRALKYSHFALALRHLEQLIHSRANNFILYCPVLPASAGPGLPGLEPAARSSSRVYPLRSQPCRSYALRLAARLALQTGSSAEETPAEGWRRSRPPKVATATGARAFPAMLVPPGPEQQASAASLYGLAHPPTLGVPIPKWAPDQTWTARASGHNRGRPADRSPVSGPLYGRPAPTCAP